MLYVVTNEKGITDQEEHRCGTQVAWSMPVQTGQRSYKPGNFSVPLKGTLEMGNGYILIRPKAIIRHLGPEVYIAAFKGDARGAGDYFYARTAHLLRPTNWCWSAGADWIKERVYRVIDKYVAKKSKALAAELIETFEDYTGYKPKPWVQGNLHEPNNYNNVLRLQLDLINQEVLKVKDWAGKAPAEAYQNGIAAVKYLRMHNNLATEAAIVALTKCDPGVRRDFLTTLLNWRINDAEDKAVIAMIKAQPKGDFTIPEQKVVDPAQLSLLKRKDA